MLSVSQVLHGAHLYEKLFTIYLRLIFNWCTYFLLCFILFLINLTTLLLFKCK